MSNDQIYMRKKVAEENKKIIKLNKKLLNIREPIMIDISYDIKINHKGSTKTQIIFFEGTTNEAIVQLNKQNSKLKFSILNFANSQHVGGGYRHGSMAQEEELCRTILDLFPSLALKANKKYNYYDFKWDEHILYSPDLSLFRYDNSQSNGQYTFIRNDSNLVGSIPIKVSVITAAAPNLRNDYNTINLFTKNQQDIYDIIYQLIKKICLFPIYLNKQKKEKKINVLILGAFGCGAFCPSNDLQSNLGIKYNKDIATLFANVLLETPYLLTIYDFIYFAIPSGDNYNTFHDVFKSFNLI